MSMTAQDPVSDFEWEPPRRRSPIVLFGARAPRAAPTLLSPPTDLSTHHIGTAPLAGALGTAAVLAGGLVAFKKGNKQLSQTMMRARIIAQGATVAVMLGTSGA